MRLDNMLTNRAKLCEVQKKRFYFRKQLTSQILMSIDNN